MSVGLFNEPNIFTRSTPSGFEFQWLAHTSHFTLANLNEMCKKNVYARIHNVYRTIYNSEYVNANLL